LVGAAARVRPGADTQDNGVIAVGHLVSVTDNGSGLTVDQTKMDENVKLKLGLNGPDDLVKDPNQ
jgi:hypothetical protein